MKLIKAFKLLKRAKTILTIAVAVIMIVQLLSILSFALGMTDTTSINNSDQIVIENGALLDADVDLGLDCKSALLMEAKTGTVLYEQNADEALPPASVTKIMTLLLVMEAVDSRKIKLDDMVTTSANAASMGGSQVYLKEGEQMTVEDMIKCVVISSANDAAVALAEHIGGSEKGFVEMMNKRAAELGASNARFENTNGLDDTVQNHVMSARDIAIISRELISHKKILEYSSIWMDTVRDGTFGLSNTNRLVRFYKGATGLKTGSTSKAKFCISATAERDGMSLICVILGSPTRDVRNAAAVSLLDWGFANYAVFECEGQSMGNVGVIGGVKDICSVEFQSFSCVVPKGKLSEVKKTVSLEESFPAPLKKGEKLGSITYSIGEQTIGSVDIVASETVEKINYFQLLMRMTARFLMI